MGKSNSSNPLVTIIVWVNKYNLLLLAKKNLKSTNNEKRSILFQILEELLKRVLTAIYESLHRNAFSKIVYQELNKTKVY